MTKIIWPARCKGLCTDTGTQGCRAARGWALEELLLAARLWKGKAVALSCRDPAVSPLGTSPPGSPSPSSVLMAGCVCPISCWDWHRKGAQRVISVLFLLIQLRAPELRLLLAVARASSSHTAGPSGPVTPWAGSSGLSEQFVFAAAKRIFLFLKNTFEKESFPELHGRARTRH